MATKKQAEFLTTHYIRAFDQSYRYDQFVEVCIQKGRMPRMVPRITDDHAYCRQDWATGVNADAGVGKRVTTEYRLQNGAGDHFVVNRACYLYGLAALYRQFVNDFLTVARFAEYWGLDEEYAAQLIELGRREHEAFVPHFKALWTENRRVG